MSDTYRWTHIKTRPTSYDGPKITTIDVSRDWDWRDYAEFAAIIVGLVCWGFLWNTLCWVTASVMVSSIIIGLGLRPDEQLAQRFLSRLFTICELAAFLGIIILPIVRLFHH